MTVPKVDNELVSTPKRISRARIVHILAIDFGALVTTNTSVHFDICRSNGELEKIFRNHLLGEDFGRFRELCPSQPEIEALQTRAIQQKGKSIWTPLFVDRYAPFMFRDNTGGAIAGAALNADGTIKIGISKKIQAPSLSLQIFRDGVISFRFSYSIDEALTFEEFVAAEKLLSEISREAYGMHIKELSKDMSSEISKHKQIGFEMKVVGQSDLSDIDNRTIRHKIIFAEKVVDESGNRVPISILRSSVAYEFHIF